MASEYVLAVDQGTSSSKAMAFNRQGEVLATHTEPVGHDTPQPGWVEQSPEEILASVRRAIAAVAQACEVPPVALGLSNQRESALVWAAATKEPLGPMLGWQDRRTAARAHGLAGAGAADQVRSRSGLPLDPMFSALKLEWMLDQCDPDRLRAEAGELRVGTLDAWLLDALSDTFRIEAGNASRTQLMNLATLDWDDDLLALFRIPRAALPPIVRSDQLSGGTEHLGLASGVPFSGVLGDSHAALFGHGVRTPGRVKVTYGTGSSIMGLTDREVPPDSGMAATLGWLLEEPARAFEGNILSTGATLIWLAQLLEVSPEELSDLAQSVTGTDGVVLVPAFAGLGAPYWDSNAQAILTGFDLGTHRAHIARAAFEAVTHQIADVLDQAESASGKQIDVVLADGGPTQNDWLMQLQANRSNRTVKRPANTLLSGTGAAYLAGRTVGFWDDDELAGLGSESSTFEPVASPSERQVARNLWADAIGRARFSTTLNPHQKGTS
ncbi:MAG: FGGY-family carbohydrate kinase [Propioniciclava sp.]